MRYRLNVLLCNTYKNILIQDIKKYAGHSKWQNIKHDKQEQDAARAKLFSGILSKMKAVIHENGNSDPTINPKLASLIDHAKKVNMPASTLKTFLERVQNAKSGDIQIIVVRNSKGIVLVLHVITDNLIKIKIHLNQILKKSNSRIVESSVLDMFECASYITASKNCTFDQAMEDAIQVDAQDVEEIKDEENMYFEFKSEFLFPNKTVTKLKSLGYNILSTENKCISTNPIEVDEEELTNIDKLKQKLTAEIKEIDKIEDNIAYTNL